ncbi:MAG: tetratricopeptide repeat protein [Prevotella sp.]|nr:tetratricopeptide repeat protein [Prevotella sp.]
MKKVVLTILVLVTALTAMAQATQPCIVKQYNQKQQKTPLAGVQVEVRDAQSATSAANGAVTLKFATLKPGDRVTVRRIIKPGYEIFNKAVIDQWTITRGATTEIVLVQSSYFTQLKSKLTQSSTDNYKKKYEQEKAEKERLLKAGKLKEEEYRQQLNDLEDQYDNALKNLDNYIDQFARIDLSEVSAEEQRILEMVEAGQIDEAVKAYEALDISGKLRQARENKKALSEAKARIEEEEAQQEQAIADLKEKQQREIATLKLAGGKENYDKVARILKENALADTTDLDAVKEYAVFAYAQHDLKDAERFYLICLNGSKDNLPQQAKFQNNLGNVYFALHDYDKADEYFEQAEDNYMQLFGQNPNAFRAGLAAIQYDLGSFYYSCQWPDLGFRYYYRALENYTELFRQNPDAYRAVLARTQLLLGEGHFNFFHYDEAEEYLLKAQENYTELFRQNPDAYQADLAIIQQYMGVMCLNLHNEYNRNAEYYADHTEAEEWHAKAEEYHAKAEEYMLMALENYTQLFRRNPDAYRSSVANTQFYLGSLYRDLHDYAKAEEYYLQALENYTQLFNHNPDAYRACLAMTQWNLMLLYGNMENWEKYDEMLEKALKNYEELARRNSQYQEDVENLRKRKEQRTAEKGQ